MSDKFPDRAEFSLAGIRKGSRTFRLTAPFRYDSRIGWLTVPAGFLTDGASIPRIFWSIFSPTGSYFEAALAALPDGAEKIVVLSAWNNNAKFERTSPTILSFGAVLGMTSDDLDNLFRFGGELTV